jgi:hypothetical protein
MYNDRVSGLKHVSLYFIWSTAKKPVNEIFTIEYSKR